MLKLITIKNIFTLTIYYKHINKSNKMTEYQKKFIPVCFKKDLSKFNELFVKQNSHKNVKILSLQVQVGSSIPPKAIYTILKNLDLSVAKCQEMEYSKERLNLIQAQKVFKISKNCDVYTIKTRTKFLKIFKMDKNFKLIRFYSFSTVYNCYFFFFKVVDDKNDNHKYCRGGVIIPMNEKKIFIYLKRTKNLSSSNHKYYFDILVNNCKVVLDVMGTFITKEDVERLSTVETLETEIGSETKKGECELFKFHDSKGSVEEEVYEEGLAGSSMEEVMTEEELVEWGDVNLDFIEKEAETLFKVENETMLKESGDNFKEESKFVIDENDEDYKKVRKLTVEDLKHLNLFEAYSTLKSEIPDEIKTYNISDNEIIRYIYGWRGDVPNVKRTIVDLQLWRKDYRPSEIQFDDFKDVDFDLKSLMEVAAQDIYGRPLILIRARHLLPKKLDIDVFVKYLIFTTERAISIMPRNVDKIAIVIDIKNAGLENFAIDHLKSVKELTSKFYVERLSNIIIINKGFFFGMLWSVVSKFLDERVLKKLVVIDNSKMPWLKKILGDSYDEICTG